MASDVESSLIRHRARIARREGRARQGLADAYGAAGREAQRRLDALPAEIARLSPDGPAEMFDARGRFTDAGQRQWAAQRYRALIPRIDAEIARVVADQAAALAAGQRATVGIAAEMAADLLGAAAPDLVGSFVVLPTAQVEAMAGLLSDGSPLRALLAEQGAEAATLAAEKLTTAAALGLGPREVGEEIARILGRASWRGEQLARNALLDAARTAALDTYAMSPHLLGGWIWTSARGLRVCLACLALDGTTFPLSVRFMGRHVACRCSPRPSVRGRPDGIETGAEWFARQSAGVRGTMIPAALYDEVESGAVALGDFVVREDHPRWGTSYRQGSVTEVRRNAAGHGRAA